MPAAAAAPPACTFCTWAPSVAESLTERALMPISACDTAPVRISSSAMPRASSMGMAKPRPIEPPSPWLWPRLRMAVLMPTTAPVASTSGAAGVAGVDRGVGLDGVDDGDGVAGAVEAHRAVQRADDARW